MIGYGVLQQDSVHMRITPQFADLFDECARALDVGTIEHALDDHIGVDHCGSAVLDSTLSHCLN